MSRPALIVLSLFFFAPLFSQIGGIKSYRFLDIPMTARAAAMGGNAMSVWDDDINLIYSNPSLLNPSMTRQLAFNYCNYVGDLNFGYFAYAHDLQKHGIVGGGIQFFNYGKFKGYNEFDEETNSFKANDYCINLTYARPFEDSSFQMGVAFKTFISQYDIYQSIGNAFDLGITWHPTSNFVLSLQARNIGWIWKSYSNLLQQNEPLPQTVQLGMSYKVQKAPFRLFMVYDQLTRWNLKYISSIDTAGKTNPFNTDDAALDSTRWQKFGNRFNNRGDNFLRHLTFGVEILVTKNFNIRLAYNHRRQREMILPERRGVNGLSLGFGFRIKRMGFAYSFTKMAFPGNSSIFSFTYHL